MGDRPAEESGFRWVGDDRTVSADGGTGTAGSAAPLPDSERLEAAAGTEEATAAESEPPAGHGETERETDADVETTRVVEFVLGTDRYCLEIGHIEEIVEREAVTRVPNTAPAIEGVVDLRGTITTILNPKEPLGIDEAPGDHILVLDPDTFDDEEHVGWAVDDVVRVDTVPETAVKDAPTDREHIRGIVDREGDTEGTGEHEDEDDEEGLVVWATPWLARAVSSR